ncbi:hypothetical protein BDK51DRAFT_43823 [Blyttiomyces helicus]|uniref:F-box domain-containing protein n=1 Tax=Blyttiomyces helicus TaxID=388810 RepID=A0A4P9VZS1_9FUNG|nr:hypothetical protein BDK51DRAFT_43823 [Blyttiomyces helicus]|eukprot:RKO83898.1 hypothetical protein BDK51DRAFT_43823 [Blyttiomyces helicus]
MRFSTPEGFTRLITEHAASAGRIRSLRLDFDSWSDDQEEAAIAFAAKMVGLRMVDAPSCARVLVAAFLAHCPGLVAVKMRGTPRGEKRSGREVTLYGDNELPVGGDSGVPFPRKAIALGVARLRYLNLGDARPGVKFGIVLNQSVGRDIQHWSPCFYGFAQPVTADELPCLETLIWPRSVGDEILVRLIATRAPLRRLAFTHLPVHFERILNQFPSIEELSLSNLLDNGVPLVFTALKSCPSLTNLHYLDYRYPSVSYKLISEFVKSKGPDLRVLDYWGGLSTKQVAELIRHAPLLEVISVKNDYSFWNAGDCVSPLSAAFIAEAERLTSICPRLHRVMLEIIRMESAFPIPHLDKSERMYRLCVTLSRRADAPHRLDVAVSGDERDIMSGVFNGFAPPKVRGQMPSEGAPQLGIVRPPKYSSAVGPPCAFRRRPRGKGDE